RHRSWRADPATACPEARPETRCRAARVRGMSPPSSFAWSWVAECAARCVPGPFTPDHGPAKGRSVLFEPHRVGRIAQLRRIFGKRGPGFPHWGEVPTRSLRRMTLTVALALASLPVSSGHAQERAS